MWSALSDKAKSKALIHRSALAFSVLDISRDRVARSMGYADRPLPVHFGEIIDDLLRQAPNHSQLEGGFRVFPASSVSVERDRIGIEDVVFSVGRIIGSALRKADLVAFFVATAGDAFTQWRSSLMDDGHQLEPYFVDALGSETVEAVADYVELELGAWAQKHGLGATNRYSPGYCGWDVAEQKSLFSLLPDNFCGVSLTESAMMRPAKSVSGFIGLGRNCAKETYGCAVCSMSDCFRRNTRYL